MAAALLVGIFDNEDEHINRNVMAERLLRPHNDVLNFPDRVLISFYRLPRHLILNLVKELRPVLERPSRRHGALAVLVQVTNALRFFAKGDFQTEVASLSSVSQLCISRNLMEVTKAICNLAPNYIQFPLGEELLRIKEEFLQQSGMPGVIGLIDGSLFPIKAPNGPSEPAYVCRKGYHAINVQAIGDQNMVIRHLLAKWPGSIHDSFIFNTRASGWLLGDSGYPLKPYLITPIMNEQTEAERKYNVPHKRCRSRQERLYGIWKGRWRYHDKSGGYLQYSPKRVVMFVKATAVLHNICRMANLPDTKNIPVEDEEEGHDGIGL
ncbi:putative nuclease HARBI1 isoform X2 [Alosa sapidissima]|uniref:putative nuclease HARBI1 isoform X2 n=1 Tax=Alosa sapidissima TaxID=34773 RepID=UPI001C09DFD8|nr:putative nuclease HARBI1 isoform X2 [Alosa sapidissima]